MMSIGATVTSIILFSCHWMKDNGGIQINRVEGVGHVDKPAILFVRTGNLIGTTHYKNTVLYQSPRDTSDWTSS
jgi:hypothetical protein